MTSNKLSLSIRQALLMGTAAALGSTYHSTAAAADATTTDDNANKDNSLQEVVITGSRIRRVDTETASPVVNISSDLIEKSGANTLGEILQAIPEISGAATNPQVNNGGGDGDATIELRGLDQARTLVLLNGRRIGLIGWDTGAVDVNMIPASAIDHVEVLKEGAGAVYGSDAIGGVVNFITRTNVNDLTVGVGAGRTSRGDGKTSEVSLAWGGGGDKSSYFIAGNYNKQEAVSSGDRDFSKYAVYLYSGSVQVVGGSSRTPNGRIYLDPAGTTTNASGDTVDTVYGCPVSSGQISVTRVAGADGTTNPTQNYRCYTPNDGYNYQAVNLIMTPQERASLFMSGSYDINDDVQLYSEFLYNSTHSGYQIAPLPFDSRNDNVVISANNIYNPFGVNLGGGAGIYNNALWRLSSLGFRENEVATNAVQATVGLKGKVPFTNSWNWDLALSDAEQTRHRTFHGYLASAGFATALGPSFIATDGTPTCGTPSTPIADCTPIDIFDVSDASGEQLTALNALARTYHNSTGNTTKTATLNFDGDVASLPAGEVKAAVGFEYTSKFASFETDDITVAQPPDYLSCGLPQETCGSNAAGGYKVRDFYGEVFVPILKDRPGAQSLNATVGLRSSNYSLYGTTSNSSFKFEYKPIKDLLIRGTYSQVYRIPSLLDLYRGATIDAPLLTDPCTGLTAAQLAANPNFALACENVTPDGTFQEPVSQVTGIRLGSTNLKPETGSVINFGFVYDPSWLNNFSTSVDFWSYKLDDQITLLDPTYAINQCVATGSSKYCGLIARFSDGTVKEIFEPAINLGSLKTSGIDIGFKYTLPDTVAGAFKFSWDSTYLQAFKNKPDPASPETDFAGTYSNQFGNYAKWRSQLGVGWSKWGVDALIMARYIDKIVVHDPDGSPGIQPDLHVGSVSYFNLTLGYNAPTHTRVQFAILNMFDKQPPLLYQNNVLNSNTDTNTYDTLGRRYAVSITQKF